MIYITARHMEPSNGTSLWHIARVKWKEDGTTNVGDWTRQQMVNWINGGGDARVQDGYGSVKVEVVDTQPPYLRTKPDGRTTDNLLSLPPY